MWEIQTRKSHQWYEHYPEGAAETDRRGKNILGSEYSV